MLNFVSTFTEVSHIIMSSAQGLNQHQYLHLLVSACHIAGTWA